MIKVCPNKLIQYANRECNAIMTIAKCTNTAASSNDSSHHSSTPAAWFASGTAYHGRRYQNLGSWTSLRSYTIVDYVTVWYGDVMSSFRRLQLPTASQICVSSPVIYRSVVSTCTARAAHSPTAVAHLNRTLVSPILSTA